jgi:hypothetical protein
MISNPVSVEQGSVGSSPDKPLYVSQANESLGRIALKGVVTGLAVTSASIAATALISLLISAVVNGDDPV